MITEIGYCINQGLHLSSLTLCHAVSYGLWVGITFYLEKMVVTYFLLLPAPRTWIASVKVFNVFNLHWLKRRNPEAIDLFFKSKNQAFKEEYTIQKANKNLGL